jgi:hypothetical protein
MPRAAPVTSATFCVASLIVPPCSFVALWPGMSRPLPTFIAVQQISARRSNQVRIANFKVLASLHFAADSQKVNKQNNPTAGGQHG